ncbi:hypothetical protein BHE74_00000503 [Ensete ventricosum]|nr:hypothetical protein GW17_00061543 [Ensete ventricosum]RWW90384.1 hypothetical protein BHE74_00000503 [Ensete ventricosum]
MFLGVRQQFRGQKSVAARQGPRNVRCAASSDAASSRLLTHYSNSLSAPYNNRKSGAGASRQVTTNVTRQCVLANVTRRQAASRACRINATQRVERR